MTAKNVKKLFLIESDIDAFSWNRYQSTSDKWERTFQPNEADGVLVIDNTLVIETPKKKILFLSEPIGIRPNGYNLLYNQDYLSKFDYIGTCHNRFCDNKKIFKVNPSVGVAINDCFDVKKTKLASMIFSNKSYAPGHKIRFLLMKEFGEIDSISKYGDMFGNKIESKDDSLAEYRFHFAIENCSEPGYYTEKINDCFYSGTIPIYYGDPEIGKVYNTDGIIFLNDFRLEMMSEKYYDSKRKAIEENYSIVKEVIKTNNMFDPINKLVDIAYENSSS
jgi:hypothetical protein